MSPENCTGHKIDVALLSEILRELTPYRVMHAMEKSQIEGLLADELPHESWYFDAWVISTAYSLLSTNQSQPAIEHALLQLQFVGNAGESQ